MSLLGSIRFVRYRYLKVFVAAMLHNVFVKRTAVKPFASSESLTETETREGQEVLCVCVAHLLSLVLIKPGAALDTDSKHTHTHILPLSSTSSNIKFFCISPCHLFFFSPSHRPDNSDDRL